MAVTGWKSAAVASDYNDSVGNWPWTKGTGAAIAGSELSARDADNSGSASILKTNSLKSGQRTFPLRARDFGFTTSDIPSGSTIDGIEIRIAVAGSGTGLTDNLIQLVMHSAGTAADRKGSNQASATAWASLVIPVPQRTYGGAADKWGSTLTDSDIRSSAFGMEIVAIRSTANHQPFADHVECRVYFTEAGGATTHDTTGALPGLSASIAGSAAHVAIHGTSGAFTGQLGSVAGSAARKRTMASSGILTGQIGSISGAAARATAPVTHAASGSLTAQLGSVSGSTTRFRAHPASGALAGQLGSISGTAARRRDFGSFGALSGQGASLSGASLRFRSFGTSGVLAGQQGTVTGSADRTTSTVTHAASGALAGQGAAVVGGAARFRVLSASGVIVGAGSNLSGASAIAGMGIYVGARTSILVGKLTPYVGAKSF